MSNSFKPLLDIIQEHQTTKSISVLLKDADKYYAHTPSLPEQKPETLSEHLDLVLSYFKALINDNGLENIIEHLINDYLSIVEIPSQSSLHNFIKELFVATIAYHDHGKINENFQSSPFKMNNPHFQGKENMANQIDTQHSVLSSFIFLNHYIDSAINIFKNDKKEQRCAITLVILFSYVIYRHHSKYLNDDYWVTLYNGSKKVVHLKDYLLSFNLILKNPNITSVLGKLEGLKNQMFTYPFESSFPLYQLLRLNFSLLTGSDYLATNEFMSGKAIDGFGVLTNKRIQELYKHVSQDLWMNESLGKINFNKKTYDELNTLSLEKKPEVKSNKNLNLLRQHMATEAIRNIRKHLNDNIFYLEAPTGGGKTNISMLLTLELLKANEELNKVFYVFPFTTLIDQSFASIKENLGLEDNEIVALHSKSTFNDKIDKEDDNYGANKKNYINHLFINYPFCLVSHIRFFDILKTNEKEINYMLHRLANSVVVLDELQAYNPKHWDKVMFFISHYAKAYHIKFIIMSATLPKIGNLEIEGVDKNDLVYLLPNARTDYFQNINFLGRVNFDFSLLPNRIDLDKLVQKVLIESKKYAMLDGGRTKPVGSVFTIIEFIFKKTATLFEQEIKDKYQDFFDEIFVLSGTILHHRRHHIINFLKRKENRRKKVLLITTQVVEAGVDIDMDLGFKDTSLIDSDEQLAGRINRNVNKDNCTLFLFNYNKAGIIYKGDLRFDLSRDMSIQDKSYILKTKDFDFLYHKVIDAKNSKNKDHNFVGIKDYLQFIDQLQFQSINQNFKLIEQENFSCFIPMEIPIIVEGEDKEINEFIFTQGDLDLLTKYNVFPTNEYKISGKEVFDVYIGLINSDQRFTSKKIALKEIQSILSKFTFSIFATDKIKTKLIPFMDIEKSEFGYLYMSHWNDFYNEKYGIREAKFQEVDMQFI